VVLDELLLVVPLVEHKTGDYGHDGTCSDLSAGGQTRRCTSSEDRYDGVSTNDQAEAHDHPLGAKGESFFWQKATLGVENNRHSDGRKPHGEHGAAVQGGENRHGVTLQRASSWISRTYYIIAYLTNIFNALQ